MRWNIKEALWENIKAIAGNLGDSFIAGSAATNAPDAETAMVRMLSAAYDGETRSHARRTARWAQAIAHYLHYSDEETYRLYLAALLHDIGKTSIPRSILHKRGALDDKEQEILRLHPEIGYHILLRAGDIFSDLAPVVMAHHERWDGQGYPAGLVGEAIPLEARILAVVDAFDAMTSRRPYQRPLSHCAARLELQRYAGSRYDAHIVTIFLTVLDECGAHGVLLPPPLFSPAAIR